jgi:hypothetical protein
VELLQEAILQHQLRLEIVQLGDAQRRRLSHVRVLVVQALLQRAREVVDDLFDADAAHRADGECADERIVVVRVLDERVDGEDDEVGLRLGVVDEIEVDELLLLDVFGLHVFENVGEKAADIFAGDFKRKFPLSKQDPFVRTLSDGHVSDDPLDGILAFVTILTIKVGAKLKVLACRTMNYENIEHAK